jgi:hypothetical protein
MSVTRPLSGVDIAEGPGLTTTRTDRGHLRDPLAGHHRGPASGFGGLGSPLPGDRRGGILIPYPLWLARASSSLSRWLQNK